MSILAKIEIEGAQVLSFIEHGAAWLVGAAAAGKKDLSDLEASNPLVTVAVNAGIAAAEKHGVDVPAVENAAQSVLTLAQEIAAAAPAPAAVPAATPTPVPASATAAS
jgi:hypothetical protein